MDSEQDEVFQIATLIVVVATALVCMCYFLIFLNPQIALNPFKPPLATPTLVAGLPATWTPTATPTRTLTPIPSATPTITLTPVPTRTSTRTRVPTRRPTAVPPPPPPPPVVFNPYSYVVSRRDCYHSGGTFIEGTVWSGFGGSPQRGVRVAMSTGPGPGRGDVYYLDTGNQGVSDGYYNHIIRAQGSAPGNYYVWIADGNGTPLSDPNAAHISMNNLPPDVGGACWRAVVDFARQ